MRLHHIHISKTLLRINLAFPYCFLLHLSSVPSQSSGSTYPYKFTIIMYHSVARIDLSPGAVKAFCPVTPCNLPKLPSRPSPLEITCKNTWALRFIFADPSWKKVESLLGPSGEEMQPLLGNQTFSLNQAIFSAKCHKSV